MEIKTQFDVIIIGGSYAGLSAAMALGRSLRKVLVIDSNLPCNRQTPHSHNFLTQDGQTPSAITSKARKELSAYTTVTMISDKAVAGRNAGKGFTITTASNSEFRSKKLVFATGIKDIMPEIPGFAECWGISVVHCPYCHGYELREKPTAIMANGERAFHLASLVNNLTKNLVVITSGKPEFTAEQLVKLKNHNIEIISSPVTEIEHVAGRMKRVIMATGRKIELLGMYAAPKFVQHSEIPESLGCELNENGYIKVDAFQKTSIPGVYACGDNSNMMRAVANAVYSGNITGAMVNKELTDDAF